MYVVDVIQLICRCAQFEIVHYFNFQNYIQEAVKGMLNFQNVFYHAVQIFCFSVTHLKN
jgi:hypothetical protein